MANFSHILAQFPKFSEFPKFCGNFLWRFNTPLSNRNPSGRNLASIQGVLRRKTDVKLLFWKILHFAAVSGKVQRPSKWSCKSRVWLLTVPKLTFSITERCHPKQLTSFLTLYRFEKLKFQKGRSRQSFGVIHLGCLLNCILRGLHGLKEY